MKKQLRNAALISILVCAGLFSECHAEQTALPVSPADFYVSPSGNDTNPGTQDKPFATILRARNAVRPLIKAGLTKDILVVIRAGTYYLPKGIRFGFEDSGTDKHRITYAAYPGEVPILIGGVRLTGWKPYKDGIWVADMPQDIKPQQIFVNGRRMELARTPDTGYFAVRAPVQNQEESAFIYHPKDFNPENRDMTDARILIWPGFDFLTNEFPIRQIDKQAIYMDGKTSYSIKPGDRYFIKNALSFLNKPGECQIGYQTGKIYVLPTSGEVGGQTITASTAKFVIAVQGAENNPVRNLHFEGLDITVADDNAVWIAFAENCSVRFCTIENAYRSGLSITNAAQHIQIYGNLIRFNGQHGVIIKGLSPEKPDVNHHHVVENNHIHHCGQVMGQAYGIQIVQSGDNRILHNDIHHLPRFGISISSLLFQNLEKRVKNVTLNNRFDFLYSRNNVVAYNRIHHVNLDSQDAGAVYAFGSGRDNVLDHNLIYDSGTPMFDHQFGVYLDQETNYFTITNNIIYGITGRYKTGCVFAKGIGNKIENNIMIVSPGCETGILSKAEGDESPHEYARNIVVFEGTDHKPGGNFGRSIPCGAGETLSWKIEVPADADYALWLCYSAKAGHLKRTVGAGVAVDDGVPITISDIPDTGKSKSGNWHKSVVLKMTRGEHNLHWKTESGKINIDVLALCSDSDWKPDFDQGLEGKTLVSPAPGKHLVIIQAEIPESIKGTKKSFHRPAYEFTNENDKLLPISDNNIFWKPDGEIIFRRLSQDVAYDGWQAIRKKKNDAASRVAEPMFFDLNRRDLRLRENSPALKMGFKPIDVTRIGLKADFPARLEKD